jgi:hypothetical protein
MKKTAVVLAWGAVLAAGAAPSLRAAAPSVDSVYTITASTTMGYRTAVALDSQNTIHAVFFDPATQQINYVKRTNGSAAWGTPVRVGDVLDVVHSSYTAMALDASRVPHVIYYSRTSAKLRRTRLSGAVWLTDDIDTFVSTFPYVSLAMTPDNNPRVLYNDEESTSTKLGVWSGSSWSTFTVTNATMTAPGGIAVGSDGRAHVAVNWVNPFTFYHEIAYGAETSPGSNAFDGPSFVVGSTMTTAGNVSLALDSNNVAHIAAFEEWQGNLLYLTGSTTTVVLSTVATTGWVGRANSIAVDRLNRPRIAALDDGAGVKLFQCDLPVCTGGVGSWGVPTVVDSTGTTGEGLDLKLNIYGSAFMTYYDGGAVAPSPAFLFATTANRGMSLAGTVRDNTAAPIAGVSVALNGNVIPDSIVTPAGGTFLFTDLLEGMYVLTPSKPGDGFEPPNRTVGPLMASVGGLDFIGGPVAFSQVDNLFDPAKGQVVTMTYSVLSGGVSIRIYALNGRLVKNLVDEFKSIGTYTVTWDGRNEEGKIVASGIYLLRVVAKGVKTIQKIAVVK